MLLAVEKKLRQAIDYGEDDSTFFPLLMNFLSSYKEAATREGAEESKLGDSKVSFLNLSCSKTDMAPLKLTLAINKNVSPHLDAPPPPLLPTAKWRESGWRL